MKIQLSIFITLFFTNVFGHYGILDSLITAKAKTYQIKTLVVTREKNGKSYTFEIKKFDRDGNVIDKNYPTGGTHGERWGYRYDSLGRPTNYLYYHQEDTAQVITELKYFYVDSLFYYTEKYDGTGRLLSSCTYRDSLSENSVWTIIKSSDTSGNQSKMAKRNIFFGDTLRLCELIYFQPDSKIKNILVFYYLTTVDSLGNRIEQSGECHFVNLRFGSPGYEDYTHNRDKFLQRQLNGEFEYAMDHIEEYSVYNTIGQLIQSGPEYLDHSIYEYNSDNQLIKISILSGDHQYETVDFVISYSYDERGLPISVEKRNLQTGEIEVDKLTYFL